MLFRGRRRSENVEDRRGQGVGRLAIGGGGIGGLLLLAYLILGGDLSLLVDQAGRTQRAAGPRTAEEADAEELATVVLADTEEVWRDLFGKMGRTYDEPVLVLFSGHVESACGFQSAAVGPFYCPPDRHVYLDLSFFDDLRRLGGEGDFAQAYVIAHEVGHHVQHLLGTSGRVHARRQRAGEREANQLSVRLELQADFYAGVWAHHAEHRLGVLEPGDLEEALRAASAIGDDRLQERSRGRVVPDSFTHGTAAQRARWFNHGFRTGDPARGDTFDEANWGRVESGAAELN